MKNIMTVDLEDWYQSMEIEPRFWDAYEDRVLSSTLRLLRLMRQYDCRATFFVLSGVAEKNPSLIDIICREGHEVGVHGKTHNFIYRQSPDDFRKELRGSMEVVERITGKPVYSYRAPFFSITRDSSWALKVLLSERIRYDSSIFPVYNYRYGWANTPSHPYRIRLENHGELIEVPVSTIKAFGIPIPCTGGAYFRIYPYLLTKLNIKIKNRKGYPVVFYIHPWEIDPLHPKVRVPLRIYATHYFNLSMTESRLRRLLQEFEFSTIGEVVGNGEKLPVEKVF